MFARCGGTGVGSSAVLRSGTFVRDKRRGGEPIGTDRFGKGKKNHHCALRFSSLANQQHRCLQRGTELGLRVISDPHGNNNNSWLVVVCGFVWAGGGCWLDGGGLLGGSGGNFLMTICLSSSQRLKKICKEWQRRFSIKS